ncbi:enterotoxin A family protein [Aestuariibius insulae]|uniref:scabin-related ADP-ribosyltransferase n=1 Tax=Aestuariibius insulae TaxID=2058287 RepID=UPI00345EB6A5
MLSHAADNTNPPSAYVSTSKSMDVANDFATGYGTRDGYIYAVDTGNKGIDVNKSLGSRSPFPTKQEIAIPSSVSPNQIKGATPIDSNRNLVDYSILNSKYYGF